ncbi:UDP-N-acetylmuramoyl-tripeptide--D-alanyl-D-alanine ligase [Pedobacter sp. HMF7647]|uniref:UDP-N-acetylmuramoyl-tripeptide--D-alanyl-D-alanine ligase n=1 Tax=Hufsiella arboris TaxID=2695275 RepID=A0A7K1Y5J2_9SPHI|nr:UDP-N-acetylmuramoyl-tripeptide--D-alanyl-D-alanine ligase [Hufsiella arboris]MXV49866.1 UDP-N-acetylmuramoyl-tripeptide--D-alanyl-D-alanine ligase [Hufsiella arboris]
MTTDHLYQLFLQNPVISTDTRKIEKDCIFFALKGDNFDGNLFAGQAIGDGAAYAVIDDPSQKKSDRFILVEDTLTTLQNLARYHRKKLNIPFIGITGTNGKTTSKELINAVLSERYKTYATKGNLNNHIGVPLTILSITNDIEMAVIEMGANHQKEIEFLCSISQPTHGLITNVGKAHLEGFGSFEGVKKTKGELYEFLAANNGIAFINRDNHELVAMSRKTSLEKIIYYGAGADSYINGKIMSADPCLKIKWGKELQEFDDKGNEVSSNLTGTYNLENLLAAITIGTFFNMYPAEINKGISSYKPANNRSQIVKTASNTLICDYYNANPSSMIVALENLAAIKAETKALILGDMFELGEESASEHQLILEKAISVDAERRIFIGQQFFQLRSDAAEFFETTEAAHKALAENTIENSTVLIKGSRGMKLESLIELL